LSQPIQYYFEDFTVGMSIELDGPRLSEAEMIAFASQYDPQPFHVDPEQARESVWGGIIASGWQTACTCMRLICDGYLNRAAGIGSPGLDELSWLKPVRPGDALRMKMSVEETRSSKSKPDRGLVKHCWEVFNQDGERVMQMRGYGIYLKRPGA
jgi:acyl dehydratase